MNKLNIFFRITKVDISKRTVEGIATAELRDKSGETCHYESTKPFYEKWSSEISKATNGKSLGNVRAMHSNIAAGKVTQLLFDDAQKAIKIAAKIVDDAEWNKVIEGVYSGFSQGGEYVKRWTEGAVNYYTADPSEVSLVDNPCLGEATFEVVKANGEVEMRKFIEPQKDKTPAQVWKTTDGKTFEKKAEAESHQGTIDAEEFARQTIAKVVAVVDDIDDKLDKREFSDDERKKLAESGHALPDGSFPIVSEQDLKNAVHAIGRAKDPEKAKAHIAASSHVSIRYCARDAVDAAMLTGKARAKAMGLEAIIPDDWKVAIVKDVDPSPFAEILGKKSGMHAEHAKTVSQIHTHAHTIMDHVHKAMHGVQPDHFMNVVKDQHHTEGDEHHVEMAHAHASMIADKCMKMVDGDAPAMSDGHKSDVHDMHKCATNVMDAAHKFLHGSEKAMHHDAHDRTQLHKMHTNAHEIAEKCVKMFGEGDSGDGVAKLAKAMSERDALVKAVGELTPKFDALQKRIDYLERQPGARKPLYAIDQGRHEVQAGDEPVETVKKSVNISALRLSPEEQRAYQFGQ